MPRQNDLPPLLVSIHMPKTAGSSFLASLKAQYGDRLIEDYRDRPLSTAPLRRNVSAFSEGLHNIRNDFVEADCIHGHFLALKYRWAGGKRPVKFITWLRDPVARLVSHYNYWKANPPPDSAPELRKRVTAEWSLEQFCLSYEFRNVYSRFLWGFPVSQLDFVGITERYDDDYARFCSAYLEGKENPSHRINVTSREAPETVDEELERRVRAWHARDVELYEQALNR